MAKYAQLISMTDAEKDKAVLDQQIAAAKMELEGAITSAKKNEANAHIALQKAQGSIPLDTQKLFLAQKSVDDASYAVKVLTGQLKELFG